MIAPIRRSRVVPVTEPLPACWLRRAKTAPDVAGATDRILRVSADGKLRQALVETIESASEVVLVASFLLADEMLAEALLRASAGGKRVYVLTASDERLTKIVREDDGFEVRMLEEHKRLLNRLAGNVSLRSAEHFHAKLLVVDWQSAPRGWLTTANFNKALLESVELGIQLQADAARAVAGWFSYVFWAESEHELAGKGRLAAVGKPPRVPDAPAGGSVVVTTKQHTSLRVEALRLIEEARRELVVASYGLSSDHRVVEAIIAKARSGVPVTVLTRPRPAVLGAVHRLEASGVRVLAHDKLHAKAILSDAGGMVMSANLEPNGLDSGFELGVVLDGGAQAELRRILFDWIERFPWRYAASAARADHTGEICLADKSLREGIRNVIGEKRVLLSAITAEDALRLDQAPDPVFASERYGQEAKELPHRVVFEWEVCPPRLPAGAKERFQEIERDEADKDGNPTRVKARIPLDPPVFDHGGRTFVVLRSLEQEDRVRGIAGDLAAVVVLP